MPELRRSAPAVRTEVSEEPGTDPGGRPSYPLAGVDGKPWWSSYFGPDHALFNPEKDEASGEAEAKAVVAALAVRPPARVLDVGCGAGRHVLALARRGFEVTGLDASPHLLASCAAARERAGVAAELRLADMRTLPLEGVPPFEAAISLFTSFGYFGDAENEQVARGLAASLAPGGRLLLDLNNREVVEKAHGTRTWSERPTGFLLDRLAYDPDAHRLHGERIVLEGGAARRYPFDHRVYSEHELKVLLKRAGLRVLATYGSLERTPFTPRSPRMVVLAEKP